MQTTTSAVSAMTLFRIKNRLLGALMPEKVARDTARLFLTPRLFPLKEWEKEAEKKCRRHTFGDGLSAARWGAGIRRILLVHGWESRATQMYGIASALVENGFEVIAIDAPLHGHSGGVKSNPVTFAEAIATAVNELGPFDGTVGHSMGAAAIAFAMDMGADPGRCVCIAAPSCMYLVLKAFSRHIGLSEKCTTRFLRHVETEVGKPSRELNVGSIFAKLKPEVLLIHARNDQEVPYCSLEQIKQSYPDLLTYSPTDLGHQRIVRDTTVSSLISDFMKSGHMTENFRQQATSHRALLAKRLQTKLPKQSRIS